MSTHPSDSPRRRNVTPFAALVVGVAAVALPLQIVSAGAAPSTSPKPTIVLEHGAFADASGWNGVTKRLQHDGYAVIAPANPERGLAPDSAYLSSILDTIQGPIMLVGHSYGGAVITNAANGHANVKALVFIAAFAPDAGETVGGLAALNPRSGPTPAHPAVPPIPAGAPGYINPT